MNRRPLALTVAAAAVGGPAVALVPQHAASVASVGAATVVVVLAVSALVLVGPVVQREVPVTALDRADARGAALLDPGGLRDARRDLAQPARGPVPAAVWERLVVAAVLRLQRHGVDVDSAHSRPQGRALLSETTWTLLTTPPASTPGSGRARPDDVARVVHRTLDELDHLAVAPHGPTGGPHGHR